MSEGEGLPALDDAESRFYNAIIEDVTMLTSHAGEIAEQLGRHNDLLERIVKTVEVIWGVVYDSKEEFEAGAKIPRFVNLGIIPGTMQAAQQSQQKAAMNILGNRLKGGGGGNPFGGH